MKSWKSQFSRKIVFDAKLGLKETKTHRKQMKLQNLPKGIFELVSKYFFRKLILANLKIQFAVGAFN